MAKKQLKVNLKDDEVFDLIKDDLAATVNLVDEISELRAKDTDILRGVPYPGDDARKALGHSTVVSKVVANTVNWTQPGLVEIFSGDFYRFNFASPDFATDLKDLVDKIWFRQQDGERTNDKFIYDSQTSRTGGILKTYYHEEYDLVSEEFEVLTEEQFQEMQDDPEITISRYEEVVEKVADPMVEPVTSYENVKTVKKQTVFKGPKIECVPPDRFGVSPGCNGNLKKARLVYDWSIRNIDYVRRMEKIGTFRKGSVNKILNEFPDGEYEGIAGATEQERENRFWVEDTEAPISAIDPGTLNSDNKAKEPANDFRMFQIYTKLDIDGDGLLEPVIITTSGNIIFSIEENFYGGPPFVIGQPFMLPHQYQQDTYGSMLEEEQKIMTNLNRMQQDAAAKSTYSNPITNDRQTFDQLQQRRPNSVILGDPERIGNLPAPESSQYILKSIELFQGDIENISGVTRYNQGLDANSLNKTYGGMQLIMTASQKRQRLVARRIGWAFRDVIYNIVKILELYPTPEFIELLEKHVVIAGTISLEDIIVDVGVSFEEKFAMADNSKNLECGMFKLVFQ